MNLYKIMLVDDEEEIRSGIINKIDWEAVGFEVVGDAENGKEALEKIELLEPNVVMTDIRMPYMDGLVLTEKIRQQYPSTKVLIFSGYDDFEYAKKAINLNVTEYILKPVNGEELTEILTKLRAHLDEEIELKRDVTILRENYRNSLPIIREHFLNDLVHGNVEPDQIDQKLLEYQIEIGHAKKWLVAAFDLRQEGSETLSLHKEQELIPISVKQLVEEKLSEYCRFVLFNSSREMIVIAAIDEQLSQTGLINVLGDICKETKRILEITITIGVGHSSNRLETLNRSYEEAINALGYKEIVGIGNTIYINDVEPVHRGKLDFDSKDESELIAAIKFGSLEKINQVVDCIISRMDKAKVHLGQYQAYVLSILGSLTRLSQQYDLDFSQIFGLESSYLEILNNTFNSEQFQQWLLKISYQMNEMMSQERKHTTQNIIKQAKQYILDHYQNPDLSVEMLCRQLHMSPAYFSTTFKKETGQAYIAYLTEVRLNKAVELLNTTDDKTYVIAAKVGYPEQNYFSYVFKKQFGVSPTKFRGVLR